jgi:hypothetical protein
MGGKILQICGQFIRTAEKYCEFAENFSERKNSLYKKSTSPLFADLYAKTQMDFVCKWTLYANTQMDFVRKYANGLCTQIRKWT